MKQNGLKDTDQIDSSSADNKEGGDKQYPKPDDIYEEFKEGNDYQINSFSQLVGNDNTQAIDEDKLSQRTGSFDHGDEGEHKIQIFAEDFAQKKVDLRMPKPFKRDKTLKKVFDKKKIIKQIQAEQKERYTSQDKPLEKDFDKFKQFQDNEYGDESEEEELEDMEQIKQKLDKLRKQPWHVTAKQGFMNFLDLMDGVKFFTYSDSINDRIKEDTGNLPIKAKFFNKAKLVIMILISISLFFSIITKYIKILGTEKSQSLKYSYHTNLTYPLDEIQKIFPFHHFIFFSKEEIQDRISCKIGNQLKDCKKIEELRCLYKGKNTQAFEDCRINILNLMNQNATSFCINHYNDMEVWKDDLSPTFAEYWMRKHACFEKTGVRKGRQFCDDIQSVTEGGDIENLFICYKRNNVEFAKEYCLHRFNKVDDPTVTNKQILDCFAFEGVPKGEEFCDLTYFFEDDATDEEKKEILTQRVACQDSLKLKNKERCDSLKFINSWTKSQLQECYQVAGYTLDKDFCLDFFPDVKDIRKRKAQYDARYECFSDLELVYDHTDELASVNGMPGIPIFRDREYCEIVHLEDSGKKFKCIEEIAMVEQEQALNNACANSQEADCKDKIILGLKKIGLYQELGADYCAMTYMWEDEYVEKFECLIGYKIFDHEDPSDPKYADTSFCTAKYNNDLLQRKKFIKKNELCEKYLLQDPDSSCEIKVIKTIDQIQSDLWTCQSGKVSQSGEAFPNDASINCTSINDKRVPFKSVTMSKEVTSCLEGCTLPPLAQNEAEGNFASSFIQKCYHVTGQSDDQNPWWQGTFENEEMISSVDLFNLDIKFIEKDIDESLLGLATIYIGGQKCSKLSENPPKNEKLFIKCVDPSFSGSPFDPTFDSEYEGTEGTLIRIEANKPGIMTICDIVANKAMHEGEEEEEEGHKQSELIQNCELQQEKCIDIFSNERDGENLYNCLERYGLIRDMLTERCIVQHSVQMPNFYYPFKNKYQCLADPQNPSILDTIAGECLNKFNDYTVENCLINYERSFDSKIGFYGGEPGTLQYYKYYGNLTESLEYKRKTLYDKIRKQRDEQLTQVSILPDNELSDIENYLCEYVNMYFHTNPYNDLAMDPTAMQNELNVSLSCQVFDYVDMDQEPEQREQLVGIHHYFENELIFDGAESITDKKLKDVLFINRTNFNEQYFRVLFEGNQLEFLQVKKSILYQSQLKATDLEQKIIKIGSQEEFEEYRQRTSTEHLYESETQILAQQKIQEAVFETRPQLSLYKDMPNAQVDASIMGIPVKYQDYKQDILLFDPIIDRRENIEMTDDEKEASVFFNEISFQYIFEKKTFKFNYNTLSDLFSALCGIGNGLAAVLRKYMIYIIMLFSIQLNYIAKHKHKQDYRKFRLEFLLQKTPHYKEIIERELKVRFFTKEAKKELKRLKKLKQMQAKEESEKQNIQQQIQLKEGGQAELERPQSKESKGSTTGSNQIVIEGELGDIMCEWKDPDEHKYIPDEMLSLEEAQYKELLIDHKKLCYDLEIGAIKKYNQIQEDLRTGRSKILEDDSNSAKTKNQMGIWELVEEELDKLEELQDFYGHKIKKKQIDPLDDGQLINDLLDKRRQLTFLERCILLKKRISFFGIFAIGDELEIIQAQYEFFKKQFDKICQKLTLYENLLVKISNENKKVGEPKDEQFSLVSYQSKSQNRVKGMVEVMLNQQIEAQKQKILDEQDLARKEAMKQNN